jgi:rod shape-determining protein MreB
MFHRFRRWLTPDVALDLGTTSTRIAIPGRGIVLEEPSVIALEASSRRILGKGTCVGTLARQMLGRTPDSIRAVQPIREGVITDFELCEAMVSYLLRKAMRGATGRPRVVVTVPSGLSAVESRAVFTSVERAGAEQVFLLPVTKAACIGAGLPIAEPLASMVCDLGGGASQVSVMSLGDEVAGQNLSVAGDHLDRAIIEFLRRKHSLRISPQTAEQIKIEIGSSLPLDRELSTEIRGLDSISGVARKLVVDSEEIRLALADSLQQIAMGIRSTIERCQPQLVADLADTGMVLTGGTAQLRGLEGYLREQIGIPVRRDHDPERTSIRGALICLEHFDLWRESLVTDGR